MHSHLAQAFCAWGAACVGHMADTSCCRCHLLMAGHRETVNVVGSNQYHASW